MSASSPDHPRSDWDVVLADGSTARVRPVVAGDATEIVALHARLSKESVRLRYFGAHPQLSEGEVARLVDEDNPDHLALVVERGGQLIAVTQYDRIPGS